MTSFDDLHHDNHRVRIRAVRRAQRTLKDEPTTLRAVLTASMADPHFEVRAACAYALAHAATTHPNLLQTLAQTAKTPHEHAPNDLAQRVRMTALGALSQSGLLAVDHTHSAWSEVRTVLVDLLQDPEADTRFQALQALVRTDPTQTPQPDRVFSLLDDPDDEIIALVFEWAAMRSEYSVLERASTALRQTRKESRISVLFSTAELLSTEDTPPREELTSEVLELLHMYARTLPHGLRALELLGLLGHASSKPLLLKWARSWFTQRLIRVGAAAALVRMGEGEGVVQLRKALNHRKPDARGYAMEWAGRLRIEELYGALVAVLNDPRDYHSDTAAFALGFFPSERSTPVLTDALRDTRAPVRVEAARVLYARSEAMEILDDLAVQDPDEDVRAAASGVRTTQDEDV